MGQKHLQYGWDAMGERDPLARDQVEHDVGRILARIDLLEAKGSCDIRQAPGMNMEHGRGRHVHVAGIEPTVTAAGDRVAQSQRMQDELAVAEIDAFGEAGRTGGVERCRARVVVKVGEGVARVGAGEQRLVVGHERQPRLRLLAELELVDPDERLHTLDAIPNVFEDRQEFAVHQDDVVAGVIDGVENLLGGKPHVDSVQGGAHHGHGKEAFEIAVAVEVHDRHGVAGLNAELGQAAGQSANSLAEDAIAVARLRPIDDLLLGRAGERRLQQVLDQQCTGMGRSAPLDQVRDHKASRVFTRANVRFHVAAEERPMQPRSSLSIRACLREKAA